MDSATIYIALAALFGIFMAWGIGANDVANAMATSVGSKALTIKQAIVVAAAEEALRVTKQDQAAVHGTGRGGGPWGRLFRMFGTP